MYGFALETGTARLFTPQSNKATTKTLLNVDIHNPAQDNNLNSGMQTDTLNP